MNTIQNCDSYENANFVGFEMLVLINFKIYESKLWG